MKKTIKNIVLILLSYLASCVVFTKASHAYLNCNVEVTNIEEVSLTSLSIRRFDFFKGLQGISSFEHEGEALLALSGGYGAINAYTVNEDLTIKEKADISTKSLPNELISSVIQMNDKLVWTPYRTSAIYVTDKNLTQRTEYAIDTKWMVGLDYSIFLDVLMIIDREKNELAIYQIDSEDLSKKLSINLERYGGNDFYDIDIKENCLFLVQRSDGNIWSADIENILEPDYEFMPKLVFGGVARPQHAIFDNNNYILLDSADNQFYSLDLSNGNLTKYKFPLPFPMRGLAKVGEHYVTTGFVRPDDGTLSENEMALFKFRFDQ